MQKLSITSYRDKLAIALKERVSLSSRRGMILDKARAAHFRRLRRLFRATEINQNVGPQELRVQWLGVGIDSLAFAFSQRLARRDRGYGIRVERVFCSRVPMTRDRDEPKTQDIQVGWIYLSPLALHRRCFEDLGLRSEVGGFGRNSVA